MKIIDVVNCDDDSVELIPIVDLDTFIVSVILTGHLVISNNSLSTKR